MTLASSSTGSSSRAFATAPTTNPGEPLTEGRKKHLGVASTFPVPLKSQQAIIPLPHSFWSEGTVTETSPQVLLEVTFPRRGKSPGARAEARG